MSAPDDICIYPRALAAAAKASRDPAWVGRVLIALAGGATPTLDQGQRAVLEICRMEAERMRRKREAATDRKRAQRERRAQ